MSSIMATLREQMEEDEDLVLLFVKRKEDNKVEHKVGQKVDYGASEFTPNLPEGISIRGRSTRSSSNVVTSCYGECRDAFTGDESFVEEEEETQNNSNSFGEESYSEDDDGDDSAGEEQLSSSESEDEDENEERNSEESLDMSSGASGEGGEVVGNRYGGITVRRRVDSSEDSSILVQQDDLDLTEDDHEEESASDMSVNVDSDSDTLTNTTLSEEEVELGEVVGQGEVPSQEVVLEDHSEGNSIDNVIEEDSLVHGIRGITVTRRQSEENDNSEERRNIRALLALPPAFQEDEDEEGIALSPIQEPANPRRLSEGNRPPSNQRVIERLARMGITVTRRPYTRHHHHHHHHQRIRIQDHQDTDQSGTESDVDTDDEMPVLIRDLDLMEREE